MAATSKLVVNFEDPDVYVEIIGDEAGKRLLEFFAFVDVVGTCRDRDIALLEDTLRPTLGSEDVRFVRLASQNRHTQLDGQLDVVVA